MKRNTQKTFDDEGKLHSFDDKPANASLRFQEWYHHGKLHREGDQPAKIYFKNEKSYYLFGSLHRETGAASIWHRVGGNYFLFGETLNAERFERIISHAQEHSYPVWLSWMIDYELVEKDELSLVVDEDGTYDRSVPFDWLTRLWNFVDKWYDVFDLFDSEVCLPRSFYLLAEYSENLYLQAKLNPVEGNPV